MFILYTNVSNISNKFQIFHYFDIICPFHFQQWCVLGALDLDQFVEDNLKDLSDWEKNFKGLKARGRDAEKLPRYGHCYSASCFHKLLGLFAKQAQSLVLPKFYFENK